MRRYGGALLHNGVLVAQFGAAEFRTALRVVAGEQNVTVTPPVCGWVDGWMDG